MNKRRNAQQKRNYDNSEKYQPPEPAAGTLII
jgi:hypothetical protein